MLNFLRILRTKSHLNRLTLTELFKKQKDGLILTFLVHSVYSYLISFLIYSEISVESRQFYLSQLHVLGASVGGDPI